jgi:hypothetical protein
MAHGLKQGIYSPCSQSMCVRAGRKIPEAIFHHPTFLEM